MLRNKKKFMMLITFAGIMCSSQLSTTVHAEGSRELVNTYNSSTNQYEVRKDNKGNNVYRPFLWSTTATTAGITRKTTFKVYAKAGETINLGSSVAKTGSIMFKKPGDSNWSTKDVSSTGEKLGYIENAAEERIGAYPLAGGYNPIIIPVEAGETGTWEFQFNGFIDSGNPWLIRATDPFIDIQDNRDIISAWDITVKDSSGDEVKGRMFTPYIAMFFGSNSYSNNNATSTSNAEQVLDNDFYVLTKDGYVYQTSMNGIDPNGFVFWSNNRGFIDKTNNKTLYHSVDGGNDTLSGGTMTTGNLGPQLPNVPDTETDITHNVFINKPNSDLPAGLNPTAVAPETPAGFNFAGSSRLSGKTSISTGGSFSFSATRASTYRLIIDTDGTSGYNLATDTVIENVSKAGTNTITWNGKNKSGHTLPAGTYQAQLIMKGGEYHFPMLDAEYNPFGIKVKLINAPGYSDPETYADKYKVYYDESDYTTANGTNVTLNASQSSYHISPISALDGVDSSNGAHAFFSGSILNPQTGLSEKHGYGDWKGIDTWTYFPGTSVALTFDITPTVSDISKLEEKNHYIQFTPMDFTSMFADGASNTLNKVKITSLPSNGELALNGVPVSVNQEISAGDLTGLVFTPDTDWNGSTSFKWNGCYGSLYAINDANVNLVINDPPVANPGTIETNEDTPKSDRVTATDRDSSDVLTYTVVSQPTHGSLTFHSDGTYTYTPYANYNGTDSFTFKANDSKIDSNIATVRITVDQVNDPPTVSNITKNGPEDTDISFALSNFTDNFTDIDTGDALAKIRVVTLPQNGTLKLNGQAVTAGQEIQASQLSGLTFTPNANWHGDTSFQWNGSDGTDYAVTGANVNISITGVNDAPTVSNINKSGPEDTDINFALSNFTDNFRDIDSDSLAKIKVVSLPVNGTLKLNGQAVTAGQEIQASQLSGLTFTPNANWNGSTSFTWNGYDGTTYAITDAHVNITITAVNDLPTVSNISKSGPEDTDIIFTAADFTNNFTDADGDLLRKIKIVTLPVNGVLKLNNQAVTIGQEILASELSGLTFTPSVNWHGSTSFAWNGYDGTAYALTGANVNINITAVNDAPTVSDISKSGPEDTDISFALSDFTNKFIDIDGDSLSKIQVVTLPDNGTLKLNGQAVLAGQEILASQLSGLTFTPNANWHGSTSFKWNGNDGTIYAVTGANVNIAITAVNDAPTVSDISKSGPEDTDIRFTSLDFTNSFSDADSDLLTKIQVISLPSNGILKLNGQIVTIGQEISASSLSSLTFTPNANWHGNTSFKWNGNDGTVYAAEGANVNITINSVNDAPRVSDISKSASEDTDISFAASDFINKFTDVDADALTKIKIVSLPSNGTLKLNNQLVTVGEEILVSSLSGLTFTPNHNWNGSTSFKWNGNDGTVYAAEGANVNITITPINDNPIVSDISKSAPEDTDIRFTTSDFTNKFSDADTNLLRKIKIITLPANGVLKLNGEVVTIGQEISASELSNLTFTPNHNWNGSTSFKWNGSDGTVYALETGKVNITITPVNDAPTVGNYSETTNYNTPVSGKVVGSDIDGDDLTYSKGSSPSKGSVVVKGDGTWVYTPSNGATGSDNFTVIVSDGHGGSATSTINIDIDTPPAIIDYSKTTNYNTPISGSVAGSDEDKDHLSYSKGSNPSKGTVVVNTDGSWTYIPNSGATGADSFKVIVNDGRGGSAISTIKVTIDTPPTVPDYNRTTPFNTQVSGAVRGIDIDNDKLQYSLSTNPSNGYIYLNSSGEWIYTPKTNFTGTDKFKVEVKDGRGGSSISTITITVRDTMTLIGTITDKNTKTVLANSKIEIKDLDGKLIYSTVTDVNGSYRIDNVKLGLYKFSVINSQYGNQITDLDVNVEPSSETEYTMRRDFQLDKSISYALKLNASPVTILGDGKSTSILTAKVTDGNNKPVANTKVVFSAPSGTFPNGCEAVTDANGIARVTFKSSKVYGTESKVIPVTAAVDDNSRNLHASDKIYMTFQPGMISGVVVDNETNKPVSGALVEVSKDLNNDGIVDFYAKMTTEADGKYEFAIPKGNEKYNVYITKPVKVGKNYVQVKYSQNSNAGEVAGAGNENYASVNTAAGVILTKETDGDVTFLQDYSNFNIDVVNTSDLEDIYCGKKELKNISGINAYISKDAGSKGVFEAEGLEKGRNYTVAISYTLPNGDKIIVGTVKVVVNENGQINLSSALIDPYGTVTDAVTHKVISGAHVKLYYADTARNRAAGRVPGSLVNLPGVAGFEPANNKNPQDDDSMGKFAFMVFPDADYYIVAEKDGYETYTSGTISVGKELVKNNIEMTPKAAAKPETKPEAKPNKPSIITLPKTGSPIDMESLGTMGLVILVSGIGITLKPKKKK